MTGSKINRALSPAARRLCPRWKVLFTALPLLGHATASTAGNVNYVGASGLWSDPSNWSTNALPLPGDLVTLTPASGSVTVQLDISSTNLGRLTIDATAGQFVTLAQAANNLSVISSEVIGSSGYGAISQSGGSHLIGSVLYLGSNSASTGRLTFSNGTFTVNGDEVLANQGDASVVQSGGTHTINGVLQIGLSTSGTGKFSFSGGSLIGNSGEIVGSGGTGQFNQSGGTHTVNSALYVGFSNGSNGNYAMTNGALAVIGDEFIGNFGNGSFN